MVAGQGTLGLELVDQVMIMPPVHYSHSHIKPHSLLTPAPKKIHNIWSSNIVFIIFIQSLNKHRIIVSVVLFG